MQKDVNKLYLELQETYDNLVELKEDGYYVYDAQIIAATYSKVGYLQSLTTNNPDFLYKKELGELINRIDLFFGITRDKAIPEREQEKRT